MLVVGAVWSTARGRIREPTHSISNAFWGDTNVLHTESTKRRSPDPQDQLFFLPINDSSQLGILLHHNEQHLSAWGSIPAKR